jgi:hypothetical protein
MPKRTLMAAEERRMTVAEKMAEQLTAYFLEKGLYEDVSPSIDSSHIAPAAASSDVIPASELQAAFAGLAVRGVGYGRVEGEDEPNTVFIYVTRSSRKKEKALLSEFGGQIRLEKVGRVSVRPELAASATNYGNTWRDGTRTACGSSIGIAGEQSAGTLGALLFGPDGDLHCLSNNHVIGGCNHTPQGQPILAPSTIDVRPGGPGVEQIALFERLNELRSGDIAHVPTQTIDAAIGRVSDNSLVSSLQGEFFDTPPDARAPLMAEPVMKVGRTTAFTQGIIESRIPVLLPLPYKAKKFTATVNFANVWTVVSADRSAFALPGDSGSLVVAEDMQFAVGLLFAVSSDGRRAWIAPMDAVLAALPEFFLASGIS